MSYGPVTSRLHIVYKLLGEKQVTLSLPATDTGHL